MKQRSTHHFFWRTLALAVLVFLPPASSGGTRPSLIAGGAGSEPTPATSPPGPVTNPAPTPSLAVQQPLVIDITGSNPSYFVVVTSSSGAVVGMGATNPQGTISFNLPVFGGLELDVVGTDVIGMPVHAGQTVSITFR